MCAPWAEPAPGGRLRAPAGDGAAFGVSWRRRPSAPRGHREDPSDGRIPEPDGAPRSARRRTRCLSRRGARRRTRRRRSRSPVPGRPPAVLRRRPHPSPRVQGRRAGPRARAGARVLLVPADRPRLLHRPDPDRAQARVAVRAPRGPPVRRHRPPPPHRAVSDLPVTARGGRSARPGSPAAPRQLHEDGRRDRGRAPRCARRRRGTPGGAAARRRAARAAGSRGGDAVRRRRRAHRGCAGPGHRPRESIIRAEPTPEPPHEGAENLPVGIDGAAPEIPAQAASVDHGERPAPDPDHADAAATSAPPAHGSSTDGRQAGSEPDPTPDEPDPTPDEPLPGALGQPPEEPDPGMPQ